MTKESIIILVADIHYLYHRAGKVLEGDDADNATSILWKTQAALSALAAERDAANEKLAAMTAGQEARELALVAAVTDPAYGFNGVRHETKSYAEFLAMFNKAFNTGDGNGR